VWHNAYALADPRSPRGRVISDENEFVWEPDGNEEVSYEVSIRLDAGEDMARKAAGTAGQVSNAGPLQVRVLKRVPVEPDDEKAPEAAYNTASRYPKRRRAGKMNLEIHNPELVQRVNAQIQSGHFHDADDLLEKALDALEGKTPPPTASSAAERRRAAGRKSLVEVFAPVRGMNLDFSRNQSPSRPVDLG
jgi:Arc/MetJ-type ribon-helix-helix transcriptional regulator